MSRKNRALAAQKVPGGEGEREYLSLFLSHLPVYAKR